MSISKLKDKINQKTKTESLFEGEILFAITTSAFLIAASDGEIAEEELEQMILAITQLSDTSEVEEQQIEELLNRVSERFNKDGFDACAKAAAKRLSTPELREAAIMIAAGVAFVDGELTQTEEIAFRRLANFLGFSDEEAIKLVEESLNF